MYYYKILHIDVKCHKGAFFMFFQSRNMPPAFLHYSSSFVDIDHKNHYSLKKKQVNLYKKQIRKQEAFFHEYHT